MKIIISLENNFLKRVSRKIYEYVGIEVKFFIQIFFFWLVIFIHTLFELKYLLIYELHKFKNISITSIIIKKKNNTIEKNNLKNLSNVINLNFGKFTEFHSDNATG